MCRCALPFSGQRRCSRAEIQGSNASDPRQHWAKRDCPARCSRDRKTEKLTPCCRYPHLQRGTCRKADIAKTPRTLGISGKRKTPRTSVLRVSRQCWRKGGDSNPRWSCPHTTFPRLHHRPLGHPSSRHAACRSELSGARSGTRTRTYSRIADFESAAAAITPPWRCALPLERAKGIEPS